GIRRVDAVFVFGPYPIVKTGAGRSARIVEKRRLERLKSRRRHIVRYVAADDRPRSREACRALHIVARGDRHPFPAERMPGIRWKHYRSIRSRIRGNRCPLDRISVIAELIVDRRFFGPIAAREAWIAKISPIVIGPMPAPQLVVEHLAPDQRPCRPIALYGGQ